MMKNNRLFTVTCGNFMTLVKGLWKVLAIETLTRSINDK
jgi:hypothetical protein